MIRQFDDIRLTPSFIRDWEGLSKQIRKRVDRKLLDWALIGNLPPSAQAHGAVYQGESILICYVNCKHGVYRMFVKLENKELICLRVLDHEDQDRALGNYKSV